MAFNRRFCLHNKRYCCCVDSRNQIRRPISFDAVVTDGMKPLSVQLLMDPKKSGPLSLASNDARKLLQYLTWCDGGRCATVWRVTEWSTFRFDACAVVNFVAEAYGLAARL